MGRSPRCYMPSFLEIGLPVLEKKILKGFYHIWAWRPSWSCDPDAANKLLFPLSKEAPLIGPVVSEKKMFEIVDADRPTTDDGRTPEQGYTKSSPMSLRLRWAKKEAKPQVIMSNWCQGNSKQWRPWSDCYSRTSLIWVCTVFPDQWGPWSDCYSRSSMIWVCTVWPDLSARKLRVITVAHRTCVGWAFSILQDSIVSTW